jgi:branched-chain amino acid aminotransferase
MLTDEQPVPSAHAGPARLDDLTCHLAGEYVRLGDAKVSILTHAFLYGTAVFEGIRAYWNAEQGQLYGLFLREHVERLRRNCRMLLFDDIPAVDEIVGIIAETVRRNGFREDAYIRPCYFKSTRTIGVRLHNLDHSFYVVTMPFGDYIDTEKGVRLMTSTWRRNADDAIPARGKIVGGYVNMAFQKSEAELNGFDEALVLTPDGAASEASAANLFAARDGVLLTPPVTDDILEGITRTAILSLARDEGIPTEIRTIDRSELYVADEMFLCGTGVQLSPVVGIDHRPIGSGEIGPIASLLRARYFDAVRGRLPQYQHWLTPIATG